jgi:hypothetical protein
VATPAAIEDTTGMSAVVQATCQWQAAILLAASTHLHTCCSTGTQQWP